MWLSRAPRKVRGGTECLPILEHHASASTPNASPPIPSPCSGPSTKMAVESASASRPVGRDHRDAGQRRRGATGRGIKICGWMKNLAEPGLVIARGGQKAIVQVRERDMGIRDARVLDPDPPGFAFRLVTDGTELPGVGESIADAVGLKTSRTRSAANPCAMPLSVTACPGPSRTRWSSASTFRQSTSCRAAWSRRLRDSALRVELPQRLHCRIKRAIGQARPGDRARRT